MTNSKYTYLVFGATGRTGRHFVSLALNEGHQVIALVRNPEKVETQSPNLKLIKGSIIDYYETNELLSGVDFVISMLGDAQQQKLENVNTEFIKNLIPAMRHHGVKRFFIRQGALAVLIKKSFLLCFGY